MKGEIILVTFVASLVVMLVMCGMFWAGWKLFEVLVEGSDKELLGNPDSATERNCYKGDSK